MPPAAAAEWRILMTKLITGVLPALITPMDEKGNILVDSAKLLIDWYEKEKADGLYMLGWTGEGMYLSVQQRKTWTEAVLKANGNRMPIFVHVGYNENLDDSVELARHAEEHGAYAVASVGISPQSRLRDNVAYFKRISDAAPKTPFYIYWTSMGESLTGGERVDPDELLEAMKAVPTFKGIKFTDNNFYILERFKKYNPDINILTGADNLVICSDIMGADGNIGALQAITCLDFKVLLEKMKGGKYKEAREIQFRVNEISEAFSARNIGTIPGIKIVMERVYHIPAGYCSSSSPYLPKLMDEAVIQKYLQVYRDNILKRYLTITENVFHT
jgi:Dihydrodipicolinate synthase/N-acetylneuraminate lyase